MSRGHPRLRPPEGLAGLTYYSVSARALATSPRRIPEVVRDPTYRGYGMTHVSAAPAAAGQATTDRGSGGNAAGGPARGGPARGGPAARRSPPGTPPAHLGPTQPPVHELLL